MIFGLFRKLRHKHAWSDLFPFDSCIEVQWPSGQERVLGRAMMMRCDECGAMERRPIPLAPSPSTP